MDDLNRCSDRPAASAGGFGVCLPLRCSCISTVGRLDSYRRWQGLTWPDEDGEVGKGEMFTACAFTEQEVGGSVKPGVTNSAWTGSRIFHEAWVSDFASSNRRTSDFVGLLGVR